MRAEAARLRASLEDVHAMEASIASQRRELESRRQVTPPSLRAQQDMCAAAVTACRDRVVRVMTRRPGLVARSWTQSGSHLRESRRAFVTSSRSCSSWSRSWLDSPTT